jgi:hypothetical protein
MKTRKGKTVLSGGWYQWEWGGHKERVKEGKYIGSTVKMRKKMRPFEIVQRRGE